MIRILKFLGAALTFLGLILLPVVLAAVFFTDFSKPYERDRYLLQCAAVVAVLIVGIILARLRLPLEPPKAR